MSALQDVSNSFGFVFRGLGCGLHGEGEAFGTARPECHIRIALHYLVVQCIIRLFSSSSTAFRCDLLGVWKVLICFRHDEASREEQCMLGMRRYATRNTEMIVTDNTHGAMLTTPQEQ